MIGYRMVKKNYDNMLSRFHLIPERHGRTDGQNCYHYRARQCADARQKNIWPRSGAPNCNTAVDMLDLPVGSVFNFHSTVCLLFTAAAKAVDKR